MSQGFPPSNFNPDPNSQPFAPPTVPGAIRYESDIKWPKVLGILSIIFGSLGVISHACQVASSFGTSALMAMAPQGSEQLEMTKKIADKNGSLPIIGGVLAIFLTGLSVFLIVAGAKTLSRSVDGVRFHIGWAIGKIIISCISMIPGYLMMQNQFEVMREMGAVGGPGGFGGFFAAMGIIGVFIGLAWACSYPIFLLVWFQRQAVKAEITKWSA